MNLDAHRARNVRRREEAIQYQIDLGAAAGDRGILDAEMSLTQLRYFVAVAEEKNVARAAARVHIAQPPLSRQIKGLEEELGVTLFQRTPKGMELLPAGETFLEHARSILTRVDAAIVATRASTSDS